MSSSQGLPMPGAPGDGATNEEIEKYKDNLVNMAECAEKAERFDDMYEYLTVLIDFVTDGGSTLKQHERNSMSVAFKNVVGALRSSWRHLSESKLEFADQYKSVLENELKSKCNTVLTILKDKLIKSEDGANNESEVFYLKMAGDYSRYLAEIDAADEHKNAAKDYYTRAMTVAENNLSNTHPTRLGLALNFSVCHYEILQDKNAAKDLAKRAFEAAIAELDTLNDNTYKDSTLIMQLLRDNLTLWTSDDNNNEVETNMD